jgi:hypothetical protein
MRYLSIIFLFISINSFAHQSSVNDVGQWGLVIPYSKVSAKVDSSLPTTMSLFEFDFNLSALSNALIVEYSVDGTNYKAFIEKEEKLKILTKPGLHVFQFYVEDYVEIMTDSLLIIGQQRDEYRLNFSLADMPTVVFKPVIYLYPEHETEITVEMEIKGTEAFLYPAYDEKWKFTAHPNGDLDFGDNTYNYLFWEAKATKSAPFDKNQDGFLVARDEVVSFLEDKLSEANLTSKEQADFITFWGPKMAQNELNFVHFIFNETCEQYANIDIQPAPKSVYRIYILFAPITEPFEVSPQKIQSANRDGFFVLEWGGQKRILPQFTAQLMH